MAVVTRSGTGGLLLVMGPISNGGVTGHCVVGVVGHFSRTKCDIATYYARGGGGTCSVALSENTNFSLVIYINNSKALGRAITKIVGLNGSVPLKFVPLNSAGSFTGSLNVPVSIDSTMSTVVGNAPVPISVNIFKGSDFVCITNFNGFATVSCSAGRGIGGILNGGTCCLRTINRFFGVGPFRTGIVTSNRIFRNSCFCNTFSGSCSINNVPILRGVNIRFGSKLFRVMLIGVFGGPKRVTCLTGSVIHGGIGGGHLIAVERYGGIGFVFSGPAPFALSNRCNKTFARVSTSYVRGTMHVVLREDS